MDNIQIEVSNVWSALAIEFTRSELDCREAAVAIVSRLNGAADHAAKCEGRAAIEAQWLVENGGVLANKNAKWARMVAVAFGAGLTIAPFVFPLPSGTAKAAAAKTARKRAANSTSAEMVELNRVAKVQRDQLRAKELERNTALAGIRGLIVEATKLCTDSDTLTRVLEAFES